jgi:hypothetical protein
LNSLAKLDSGQNSGTQRSTALVTNVDFDGWSEYLGDPPLVMAVLDRVVDGAIVLKLTGKSYRAHRAKQLPTPVNPAKAKLEGKQ